MPLYTFELQDGQHPVGDETGVWFADRERALDHAHRVARELMSAREVQTRTWRLDVYEDGSRVEQVPCAHAQLPQSDPADRRGTLLRHIERFQAGHVGGAGDHAGIAGAGRAFARQTVSGDGRWQTHHGRQLSIAKML